MSPESSSSGTYLSDLVIKVEGRQEECFVQRGLTIGRADSNSISLDDVGVEPIHARVVRAPDGVLFLKAESSTARILVDGSSLSEVRLDDQVRFTIGTATFLCLRHKTLGSDNVFVTDNPWRVQCPVCYAAVARLPLDAMKCPSCGSGLMYRKGGDDGGFEGWLPRKVGPYNIRAFVGQGGMGVVLRGLHETMDLPAAVKLLRIGDDPILVKRFLLETDTLRSLQHPNVVTLQDHGQDNKGRISTVLK